MSTTNDMSHWVFIAHNPVVRRRGRSTAMAAAARMCGGAVVCMNHQVAKEFEKEHGVPAVSVETPERYRGTDTVFLFEPEAVAHALGLVLAENSKLRSNLLKQDSQHRADRLLADALKADYDRLVVANADLQQESLRMKRELKAAKTEAATWSKENDRLNGVIAAARNELDGL